MPKMRKNMVDIGDIAHTVTNTAIAWWPTLRKDIDMSNASKPSAGEILVETILMPWIVIGDLADSVTSKK